MISRVIESFLGLPFGSTTLDLDHSPFSRIIQKVNSRIIRFEKICRIIKRIGQSEINSAAYPLLFL